jgi:capsular exopolysaccharide synthesis family protein
MIDKQPLPVGHGQIPRRFMQTGSGGSLTASRKDFSPKDILDILRRHLFLIIGLTMFGAVGGCGLWYVLRIVAPKYTARTYIEVLSPGQFDPTVIGTPIASKDIAYEFRFSKATLIKQQSVLQELIRRDAVRETRWFKKFNNDVVRIIEDLDKNLGAYADRNSNYILVSMTCGSPKEAALIVNQMIDLFVRSQQTTAEAGVGLKLSDLSQQENELRDKLRSIGNSLADIRRSTGITQLEGKESDFRNTITQKFSSLELEKLKLEADMEEMRASAANYEERKVSDEIVQRSTENDPIVIGLIQRIVALEGELARKLTNLGENHREVQQLREILRQTISEKDARGNLKAQQIRDSDSTTAKDQLSVVTNRLAKLEELRAQTENEQRELDNTKATYNQLTSDRDETKDKLFSIQEQISKYNLIKQDTEASKVRSVGLAPEPLRMSSPQLFVFAPAGTFLGFLVGVGLAFLIELLNDLLRTPSDVMKFIDITLLGMITHKDLDDDTRNVDMWKVARQSPFSMISEGFRQFRANLKLSSDSGSQKVIFITSGSAGEGRTTIAVNTAATFVAENKRVLLIDANFRRPSSYKIFPNSNGHHTAAEKNSEGLSAYLVGNCSVEEVIRPTGFESTDVIDSGQLPANPTELLGSKRMADLIKYTKERYDHVIIDGPPMLISEAKALALQADGTVLVFNAAITRRGTAKRIVRELREMNTNILGAVLIGVRVLKGGYFREMFDSYQEYQISHKEQAVQKV